MRAISDEAVKALINSGISTDTDADREYVCECIDNIPTIEPKTKVIAQITFDEEKLREIVKKAVERFKEEYEIEPKRGEWLEWIDCEGEVFWKCSACGQVSEASAADILYKFCPFCGARMKGADDE